MSSVEPRLECPACQALMVKLHLRPRGGQAGAGGVVVVDHCRRCGGVWLQAGEVLQLRQVDPADFWQQALCATPPAAPLCTACEAPLARDAAACEACGHAVARRCPECQDVMSLQHHEDVRLDICRRCRGVWFDFHELESVWRVQLGTAVERRRSAGEPVAADAGSGALDVLIWAPDLGGAAAHGLAQAGGAVARTALDAAAHAPEAAAATVEVVAEAGSGVFSVIVEIIGGIFS